MSARDFWSRRKAAVQAEAEREARHEADALAASELQAMEQKPDEEILAELNLPDPDTLGPGDDFAAFLAKAVPAHIRTRALRRLWSTKPSLANLDGLLDYGEDFAAASLTPEKVHTAYEVGQGMRAHVEALAREAAKSVGGKAKDEDVPESAPAEPVAAVQEAAEVEKERPAQPAEAAPQAAAPAEENTARYDTPRRMHFRFEEPPAA